MKKEETYDPTGLCPTILCPTVLCPTVICPTVICPTVSCPTVSSLSHSYLSHSSLSHSYLSHSYLWLKISENLWYLGKNARKRAFFGCFCAQVGNWKCSKTLQPGSDIWFPAGKTFPPLLVSTACDLFLQVTFLCSEIHFHLGEKFAEDICMKSPLLKESSAGRKYVEYTCLRIWVLPFPDR